MTSQEHLAESEQTPRGAFVVVDEVEWYRIDEYDLLDPFLVTLVSPTDRWMFVSSTGALTAGRRSASHAVFPYETDDRLHRSSGRVGPVTIVRADDVIWEPFAPHIPYGSVRRSIAKTTAGDRLRFEERHPVLGMTFRYTWASTDRFGFVRTCELVRDEGGAPIDVEVLDGVNDVLPAGVDLAAQQTSSTLVDAYRRAELDTASGLALFTLEAMVSDLPEPAESLRATAVWSTGLRDPVIVLSDRQLRRYRSGLDIEPEHLVTGRKGGYFAAARERVEPGARLRWVMTIDTGLDHGEVANLRAWTGEETAPAEILAAAVDRAHRDLLEIVSGADAMQETADRRATAHHFANVLFNGMRGGVFLDEHRVSIAHATSFVASRNLLAAERFGVIAGGLDPVVEIGELRAAVAGDADLARLVSEYLPLSFSRRHGDPSRPWNTFEISATFGSGGGGYEGNWRDIFQNWDALSHSYPEYIPSIIAKFLNASTVDGFNPYRITDHGIDWEMPEEGDWANFGYWGDHQITYLHRLLDASQRFHPGALAAALDTVGFSYADTPYRILPYEAIVRDPKHTIVFDYDRQAEVEARMAEIGADGLLVPAVDGSGVHLASLAEKLLVPALAKLSNFVAGGGIWMNTQRPEWNDANNALVGNGVSMVTLFYLREYVGFLDRLLATAEVSEVPVGGHVAEWIEGIRAAFEAHSSIVVSSDVTPADRRSLLDDLGEVFSSYRTAAYQAGPGPTAMLPITAVRELLTAAEPFLEHAVRSALRTDGLMEAYGSLRLGPDAAEFEPLYEMLEGQVAALSSSETGAAEAIALVDAMFESRLYRPDQHTFLLYPNRRLPAYREKNVVPDAAVGSAASRLLEGESGILYRDGEGIVRFDASFQSARDLASALDDLTAGPGTLDDGGRAEILDLYESVFHHAAFTGRSGTMYRYEGLGSVYWHMVSKLLYAIQERLESAIAAGESRSTLDELAERYRRVRAGLGFVKSVTEQGTFPTDPHSHTPAHTGAQQPGMTGQVKEGVLLRWGELGVAVQDGRVRFRPVLLSPDEFVTEPRPWPLLGPGAVLDANSLGFTYCGVPVVYHLVDAEPWTEVVWSDGTETSGGDELDVPTSRAVFERRGRITRIDVGVSEAALLVGSKGA